MKSMADKDNVASDFLFTIQALAISSRAAGKIDNLRLTIFLSLAAGASRELPEGEDAFSCALMFAEAYLPEHASTRAAPGYKVPKWLKVDMPQGERQVEDFIDGKWVPSNPRWDGLPGDRSADLEIMAVLRERRSQTLEELVTAGCGSARSVRARLARLEKLQCVDRSNRQPPSWYLRIPLPK